MTDPDLSSITKLRCLLNRISKFKQHEIKLKEKRVKAFTACTCDHPRNDNFIKSSDPILSIIERKFDYWQVMNILLKLGLVNQHYESVPHAVFKCRMILVGVALLMIRNHFFTRNFYNNKHTKQKLSEKEILKRIAKSWNLSRIDQIQATRAKLINLAVERIPALKQFDE